MNKVILMGRLTKDPEYKSDGTGTARFSLAVDRRFKKDGGPDADFFNCVAFGKTSEFVWKYLTKGTKVLTIGRIQNDNYTNREGQKVFSVQIIIDEIEFAESKKAAEAQENAPEEKAEKKTEWTPVADILADEELPFNF